MNLEDLASAVGPWLGILTGLITAGGAVLALSSQHRTTSRLRADIAADVELLKGIGSESDDALAYDLRQIIATEVTELANRVAYRRIGLLALIARLSGVMMVLGIVYILLSAYFPQDTSLGAAYGSAADELFAQAGALGILGGVIGLMLAGMMYGVIWFITHFGGARDEYEAQLQRALDEWTVRRTARSQRRKKAEVAGSTQREESAN